MTSQSPRRVSHFRWHLSQYCSCDTIYLITAVHLSSCHSSLWVKVSRRLWCTFTNRILDICGFFHAVYRYRTPTELWMTISQVFKKVTQQPGRRITTVCSKWVVTRVSWPLADSPGATTLVYIPPHCGRLKRKLEFHFNESLALNLPKEFPAQCLPPAATQGICGAGRFPLTPCAPNSPKASKQTTQQNPSQTQRSTVLIRCMSLHFITKIPRCIWFPYITYPYRGRNLNNFQQEITRKDPVLIFK